MTTGLQEVSFLKLAKSSGRCHGSFPAFQMTRFVSAIAAISTVFMIAQAVNVVRILARFPIWANRNVSAVAFR